jgi:hypothetical protein
MFVAAATKTTPDSRLASRQSRRPELLALSNDCSAPNSALGTASDSPIQLARIKIRVGVLMADLVGLAEFVSKLRAARTSLADELRRVDAALTVLGKMRGGTGYAKPGRIMSPSARRRISLAQKARWAKARGKAPKPKRTLSAAGRKRIAAASRARWAAFRAAKKKAA